MKEYERTPDDWEFKITIPIFRAYEQGEDMVIQGLGGDSLPDGYNTRLSRACVDDLKDQARSKQIPFIKEHWGEDGEAIQKPKWFDELGFLIDALVTPLGQIFPKILLYPEMELARSLFRRIRAGKKLGMSYGGRVVEAHSEPDPINGGVRRVFDRLELWHFVPTTMPVNTRTLNHPLEIVAKSFKDWGSVETIENDEIDFLEKFEDREQVVTIFREWNELTAGDPAMEGGMEEVVREKWFQRHGAKTEGDLNDGDFAWLSDAYRKMSPEEREKANKSDHRKLPYKVHGKVYPDGWRAAWNAAHGARSAMNFSGGPSKEEVIAKLLRAKPKEIKVSRSERYPDELIVVEGTGVFRSENAEGFDLADVIMRADQGITENWWKDQGVKTVKELSDDDFAWLSEEYRAMGMEQRRQAPENHRRFPHKVHGAVVASGWMYSWAAAHRADDLDGGPTRGEVLRTLLSVRPAFIQIRLSDSYPDELLSIDGFDVLKSHDPDTFEFAIEIQRSEKEDNGMNKDERELLVRDIAESMKSVLGEGLKPLEAFTGIGDSLKEVTVAMRSLADKKPDDKDGDDGKGGKDGKDGKEAPKVGSEEFRTEVADIIKETFGDLIGKADLKGKGGDDAGDGGGKEGGDKGFGVILRETWEKIEKGELKFDEIEDQRVKDGLITLSEIAFRNQANVTDEEARKYSRG